MSLPNPVVLPCRHVFGFLLRDGVAEASIWFGPASSFNSYADLVRPSTVPCFAAVSALCFCSLLRFHFLWILGYVRVEGRLENTQGVCVSDGLLACLMEDPCLWCPSLLILLLNPGSVHVVWRPENTQGMFVSDV
ncbi:hypothetical protein EJB05_32951, partial [Eragrostis curvula]